MFTSDPTKSILLTVTATTCVQHTLVFLPTASLGLRTWGMLNSVEVLKEAMAHKQVQLTSAVINRAPIITNATPGWQQILSSIIVKSIEQVDCLVLRVGIGPDGNIGEQYLVFLPPNERGFRPWGALNSSYFTIENMDHPQIRLLSATTGFSPVFELPEGQQYTLHRCRVRCQ